MDTPGHINNFFSNFLQTFPGKFSKKQKLAILDEKLLALEQKLKEIRQMKKLITEFKNDVLDNRC